MTIDEQVMQWLDEAERDLQAAEVLKNSGFSDRSVVHAQQGAEKAVKALFIRTHQRLAPRSHKIDEL